MDARNVDMLGFYPSAEQGKQLSSTFISSWTRIISPLY